MPKKSPTDRALDACNTLLEVIGPDATLSELMRHASGSTWPGFPAPSSRDQRLASVQLALLGDASATQRFLQALPEILRRHDVFADYPEVARRLVDGGAGS